MTTAAVSFTVPSPAWTGSVDVTAANLDTDLTVLDFKIFYNGTEQGAVQLALWAKVSSTSLSYSGAALTTNDVVVIRRNTPALVIAEVSPLDTITSALWNAEFDRIIRRDEEFRLYGLPTGSVSVSDEAYASGWNSVTTVAPSKNAVFDKLNLLTGGETGALISDTAYATSWNGVTTIAPSKNAVYDAIVEHRNFGTMNGRLTLTSNTPILSSGSVSGTTIYYTPYLGNNVYLHDGTRWNRHTLTEISISTSGATNDLPYDIFLYSNSGTLTLERLAWTNRTTRATSLVWQDGVLVKNGDTTRRYLGSFSTVGGNCFQCSTQDISSDSSMHNTLVNNYNVLAGKARNAFSTIVAASGAWNLFYANSFSRILYPYLLPYTPTMSCGMKIINGSGATLGVSLTSCYEGLGGTVISETGLQNGLVNGAQLETASSGVIPIGIGLFSMEARYWVNTTASVTFGNAHYFITYPY